ncbi:oligopeptidase A [Entamoeba marina]
MSNPFLDASTTINWKVLTAEHVIPDIRLSISNCKETIKNITTIDVTNATFENVVRAFDLATIPLQDANLKISVIKSCHSDDVAFREAHETILPEITEFEASLYTDPDMFELISKVYETKDQLEADQKRLVEEIYNDFVEGGAALNSDDKQKLVILKKEISQLTEKFSHNVVDAVDAYELYVTEEKIKGVPEATKVMYKNAAEKKGKEGYLITLQAPSYIPLMKYCENENIRKEVFNAYNEICHNGKFDNTNIINEVLNKRKEVSQLLNFKDFSDFTTYRRMVKNGSTALEFVDMLKEKYAPYFDKEMKMLEEYKETKQGEKKLKPWDMSYYIEQLKVEKYSLDEEEFRKYFTLPAVLGGLFEIFKKLYGIQFVKKDIPGWHEDVTYYDIFENNGDYIGGVYFDFFPRTGKQNGAWHDMLRVCHQKFNNEFVTPLGIVVSNITPPIDGVARLNHDEVETIFHECGHLMHTMFSKQRYPTLLGMNVACDFVELPSQIMENWTFEREALDLFASVGNVEKLPQDLFDKMWRAKNYMTAYYTMRQLSFAKLDLELHQHYLSSGKELDTFIDDVEVGFQYNYDIPILSIVRRFTHIFADFKAYASGYYSYKWAEVLDADAFEYFKENGIFNSEVASKFKNHILKQGNSKPADVLYREFRGRDPELKALLIRSGLVEK